MICLRVHIGRKRWDAECLLKVWTSTDFDWQSEMHDYPDSDPSIARTGAGFSPSCLRCVPRRAIEPWPLYSGFWITASDSGGFMVEDHCPLRSWSETANPREADLQKATKWFLVTPDRGWIQTCALKLRSSISHYQSRGLSGFSEW